MKTTKQWTAAAICLVLLGGCSVLRRFGLAPKAEVLDHWAEAESAYLRKHYDEAASHYAAIKSDDPKYQHAQVNLGRCLWRQKQTAGAASQLLLARRLDTAAFDANKRFVRDLSKVYAAAASRVVAHTGDPIRRVFPLPESRLLLLSYRDVLMAMDAKGATTWEMPLKRPRGGGHASVSFLDGTAFTVAHGAGASELRAIDPNTGQTKWSHELGRGHEHASADVVAGFVYAPTAKGIVALDASSGEAKWEIETRGRVGQLIAAGDAICGEVANEVACWTTSAGAETGRYAMPQRSDKGGITTDGTSLYLASDDSLYALTIDGMRLAWKQLVGDRVSVPVLDASQGVVAVATMSQLLTFDAASGDPRVRSDKPPSGSASRLPPTPTASGWVVSSGYVVYGHSAMGIPPRAVGSGSRTLGLRSRALPWSAVTRPYSSQSKGSRRPQSSMSSRSRGDQRPDSWAQGPKPPFSEFFSNHCALGPRCDVLGPQCSNEP